jgi:hypothetical protein
MRGSLAIASLWVIGAAAAVGAGPISDDLKGSDVLYYVTRDVIAMCPLLPSAAITADIGGSNLGAALMNPAASLPQMLAPMGRTLRPAEYCSITPSTTNALLVGLDSVAIMANQTTACRPDLAQSGRTFSYLDGGVLHTYTVTSSLDVLGLIYGGTDRSHGPSAPYGCGGAIRRALVQNWSALFNADCATPASCPVDYSVQGVSSSSASGLSHAWRRGDLSDTSDAFVSLVGFGARQLGPSPNAPNAGTPANPLTTNPFCNSRDANDGSTSVGSAADYADLDPIRVTCDDNDTVCEMDNTLGLVLPIRLPDTGVATLDDAYPSVPCSPACALSDTGDPTQECPRGGPKRLGRCYQPVVKNADGTTNFQCVASLYSICFGDKGVDGRAYNLPLKQRHLYEGGEYALDFNGNLMTGSFFRIHMDHPPTYAPGSSPTCRQADETKQIGCLAVSDPCSIGFASRQADAQAGSIALSVNGVAPRGAGGDPDSTVKNLTTGTGSCTTNADCAGGRTCIPNYGQCFAPNVPVYPLSYRLYVASLAGLGNLAGNDRQLVACFGDNNIVKAALANNGLVALTNGVQCIDYPELNLGASRPYLAACPGATPNGTNTNACAGPSAPVITH